MKAVAAALLACLALSGCFYEETDHREVHSTRADRYYDPVCDVEVYHDSPWRADYDGHVYYFHDRDCRDRFRERPHAYLNSRDHRHYYEAH